MKFSHRLEGGEELQDFLKQFPVKTERKFLVAGLRGSVKRIKTRIRREIKANFKQHTGVLMRSVKHRSFKAKHGAGIVIQTSSIENETKFIRNKQKRRNKIQALKSKKAQGKFKDAYYARFLIKGTKRKDGGIRIKPTPFLDDALEAEEKGAISDFTQAMTANFEKEAKKMLKWR